MELLNMGTNTPNSTSCTTHDSFHHIVSLSQCGQTTKLTFPSIQVTLYWYIFMSSSRSDMWFQSSCRTIFWFPHPGRTSEQWKRSWNLETFFHSIKDWISSGMIRTGSSQNSDQTLGFSPIHLKQGASTVKKLTPQKINNINQSTPHIPRIPAGTHPSAQAMLKWQVGVFE